jgi:hypothetical protein
MNGSRYVVRGTQLAARMLGDEMMIMSASTSTLFTLNEVAAVIWQAADGATPLHEIVMNQICNQFDVPLEVAMRDAENVVEQLASLGVLVLSDTPIVPSGIPLEGTR